MQSKREMVAFVSTLLKDNLPAGYYFHCLDHTLFVYESVKEIGKKEKCTDKEIDLLCAAALWHDAGYINVYSGHEEESCRLAKIHLPGFGYSEAAIEIITGIIMATRIPQSPLNKLEEIIADADLAYLGTDAAAQQADNLYKELHHLNPSLTKDQWNEQQISFLQQHHYFTGYCREKREPGKQGYLEKLKSKSM
jgi:predicted metal-dependent HD superfamily phosphohydrolase